MIGKEEEQIFKPVFEKFSEKEVQGPLCPDAAFLKKNWEKYSFFVAIYHDQGLIPFKMGAFSYRLCSNSGTSFFKVGGGSRHRIWLKR